jgi:hypothetical protein
MDARRYDSYGPLLWFARMRARLHFAALFSFFLSLSLALGFFEDPGAHASRVGDGVEK